MHKKKTEGIGNLPSHCPSCNVDEDWDRDEFNLEAHSQHVTCNVCGDAFWEMYTLTGWEKDGD